MAYYLEIAPNNLNQNVVLDSLITPPASFNLEFEIDVTATEAVLFAKESTGADLVFFTDLNTLNIRINNAQNNITLNTSAAGRHKYNIVKIANNIELFQDDVSCGSFTSSNFYTFETLINFNNNTNRALNFYYAKLTNGSGTLLHSWNKQTLAGSNDTLFPDTVGGNDGTLYNFQTDNSQWIFYSDTTIITSGINFSVTAPSFSVSASPSLPQPDSSVSFSISGPSFSVSAYATLPQPESDINFSISGPSFSIGASATLPDSSADVGFSIVGPIFSISAFAGTIEIIVDDETNISVPSLSTNINI